jgi:nucleotide-binding universal stress UspA family protein
MFKTIAVGTDGTETADKALGVAIDIAERYRARLLIFSVYKPVSLKQLEREREDAPDEVQWSIHERERVDAILARAVHRARAIGLESETVARVGDPSDVICELASEHDVDLLVIGNKGISRRVLGSVPKSIVQHAPCSVVVAKTT